MHVLLRRSSTVHLKPLIGRSIVHVDHFVLVTQTKKTLRMPDEQISLRIQATIKLVDKPFLFGLIEINHYVAAENYVIALRKKFSFQIVEVEMDQFFYGFLDRVLVAGLIEITQAERIVHLLHVVFVVDAFL